MTPTTTSTCPSCGGTVLSGDRFCGGCGNPITPRAFTPRASSAVLTPSSGTAVGPLGDPSPWAGVAARLQQATLGEFEILTELGRGGMAAVYLARDLALNRRVAIKVMAPGLLLGPGMVERFRQEAVTVANLQHAYIVSIHAVRQLEELHFFVMQFVPGRTLEGVLRNGPALPIPVVRTWLYQVGSALGYAHRRGVIHRDVKPGNILLNADGEAVVTDFGIAKVAESPSHTQTGTVVGTPVYMSPEQCYAKELTGASDQYSLGVVAYEMLTGRPPFAGSSFALMRSHTDEPPPPVREARPDVPAEMEAALLRMLAKRPEDRFTTLSEALVALGATALSPDHPLMAELQKLAAVSERLDQLGDIIRTPASPVPMTRERPKPRIETPASVVAPRAIVSEPAAEPAVAAPSPKPASKSRAWRWVVPAVAATVSAVAYLVLRPPTLATAPANVASPAVASVAPKSADTTATATRQDTASAAPDSSTAAGAAAGPAVSTADSTPAAPAATKTAVASRVEIRPAKPAPIAPGETIALDAIVRDVSGAPFTGAAIKWTSSNVRVATIDAARGLLRGIGPGAARVTARVGDVSSSVVMSVVPSADPTVIASIDIADVRPLTVGESVRLTATVLSGAGSVITGALLDWASSNPNVASVSQDGLLTARAAGSTTVHASSGGRSGDQPVTVRARDVAAAPATPTTAPSAGGKSEADLKNDIEVLLAAYVRAIETRDTSLIRRAFPSAGEALMTRWQTTFDDARTNIEMSAGTIELLDTPRDTPGTQVRARARYSARFSSRSARSDQSFPVAFTAVFQRDVGAWRITSIR